MIVEQIVATRGPVGPGTVRRAAHRRHRRAMLTFALAACLVPSIAAAQVEVSGTVTDFSSNEPVAGVLVEASSPALIQQRVTDTTDDHGRYRFGNLRPGVYTFTFRKTGFLAFVQADVELSGVAQEVHAKLASGNIDQEIRVSGTLPTIDTRGVRTTQVFDRRANASLPVGTGILNAAALLPEIGLETGLAQQDVGNTARSADIPLVTHGSKGTDQSLTRNGLPASNMVRGGSIAFGRPASASAEELIVDTSTPSIESATGGVRIDVVPQQGGNELSGEIVANYAGSRMQGSNDTDELKQRGLVTPGGLEANWETHAAFGGPVVRDRVWFFAFGRQRGADFSVANMFYNRNAGNPAAWEYAPDPARPAVVVRRFLEGQGSLTVQASPGHQIRLFYDQQRNCLCPGTILSTTAPEAARDRFDPLLRSIQAGWTYTVRPSVLLEAGAVHRLEKRHFAPPEAAGPSDMVAVVEQGGALPGLSYRSLPIYFNERYETFFWRVKLSHITGSHQVVIGAGDGRGNSRSVSYSRHPLSFRLLEGVPNQLTMHATPYQQQVDVDHDFGGFAEHKWAVRRLTSSLGLRYDYFTNSFPDQRLGPGVLVPDRDLSFPAAINLRWHDLSPRVALALDTFGNGRSTLGISVSRSLSGYGTALSGIASDANPIAQISLSADRSWIDFDRDYHPDCDLLNPAAQDYRGVGGDRCGELNPSTFGTPGQARQFDSHLQRGWGTRDYNWLFVLRGAHEVRAGAVVEAGYFRRHYGGFQVTDNRAVGPGDFDTFSVIAPTDPRLPGGGGYVVDGFPNVTPSKFGQVDNVVTLSQHYGTQRDQWHGVDVSMRANLAGRSWVRGGLSTGRLTTDNCEIAAQIPEVLQGGAALRVPVNAQAWLPASFCRQQSPWLTHVKAFGGYPIPRSGARLTAVFQSLPGVPVLALYTATNAAIRPSLGRDLSGGVGNVPVHLVKPGTMYGERLHQLDLRFERAFGSGRTRLTVNADVYNVLNASTILTQNNAFRPAGDGGGAAVWLTPTDILPARFLKLGAQLRF
jgi:hypothetical protein